MIRRWPITQAAQRIKNGGIIVYPTESVFGIGCDPANLDAVSRLLKIKQRSYKKGLILLVSDLSQLLDYVEELTPQQKEHISQPRSRATTWLLPAKKQLSPLVKGEHRKVAIRLTSHPLAKALCQALAAPLISTSCNKSAKPTSSKVSLCRNQLWKEVDYFVAGSCLGQKASQIIDLESGKVLRA